MRGHVPSYELRRAADLPGALAALAADPELVPFAGGTDLMVELEAGVLPRGRFLDIRSLDVLRGVELDGDSFRIGALSTYSDVREDPRLGAELPNLVRAARLSGALAIQNRGTIGGNIVNASPAADTPPALLAYGAEVELQSAAALRRVAYEHFHTGYKLHALRPDELLRAVCLPRPAPGTRHFYRKVGTRAAQAISKVTLAAAAELDGERIAACRIGLGSVAPTVVRARGTEAVLVGAALDDPELERRAREAVVAEIAPIDDDRSTAAYRRGVSANLVGALLRGLRAGELPRTER